MSLEILCGTDIIEIERIKKSMETTGNTFRNRVFTENEISYCEGKKVVKYQSYASRFAAKEAVSKAFGTGIAEGIGWKDIEVLNDEKGKPFVILGGKAKEVYDAIGAVEISLSMSHCEAYAVAYVTILKASGEVL